MGFFEILPFSPKLLQRVVKHEKHHETEGAKTNTLPTRAPFPAFRPSRPLFPAVTGRDEPRGIATPGVGKSITNTPPPPFDTEASSWVPRIATVDGLVVIRLPTRPRPAMQRRRGPLLCPGADYGGSLAPWKAILARQARPGGRRRQAMAADRLHFSRRAPALAIRFPPPTLSCTDDDIGTNGLPNWKRPHPRHHGKFWRSATSQKHEPSSTTLPGPPPPPLSLTFTCSPAPLQCRIVHPTPPNRQERVQTSVRPAGPVHAPPLGSVRNGCSGWWDGIRTRNRNIHPPSGAATRENGETASKSALSASHYDRSPPFTHRHAPAEGLADRADPGLLRPSAAGKRGGRGSQEHRGSVVLWVLPRRILAKWGISTPWVSRPAPPLSTLPQLEH